MTRLADTINAATKPPEGDAIHQTFGEGFTEVRKNEVFESQHPRGFHGRWIDATSTGLSSYEPDPTAPDEGEFVMAPDPSGFYKDGIAVGWRQKHEKLLEEAFHSWRGDPVTMEGRMTDVREGRTFSMNHETVAAASALLWELNHNAKPNTKPLYRGAAAVGFDRDRQPRVTGWRSWSESKVVAGHFGATKPGHRVVRLRPGEAEGIPNPLNVGEGEWIARPRLHRRSGGVVAALPSAPDIPDLSKITDESFRRVLDSGRYEFKVKEVKTGNFGPPRFTFSEAPADNPPGVKVGGTTYGGTPYYYDSEIATNHPGAEIGERRVTLDTGKGWSEEPPLKAEPGMVFRGISDGELESILKTGVVHSHGEYNVGGESQRGTTSVSTNPGQADSYAGGFAPTAFKPTFAHPSYIIQIRTDGLDVRRSPLMADDSTERDVHGDIPASAIVRVVEVRPYEMLEGEQDVASAEYYGDFSGERGAPVPGGGSGASGAYAYRLVPLSRVRGKAAAVAQAIRKDAAFERKHPRDPLNGRWVVIIGGHLDTAEALGHDLSHASERVAEAHREGKTAEGRALHRKGGGPWRLLSDEENKVLADAAARKLKGAASALPGVESLQSLQDRVEAAHAIAKEQTLAEARARNPRVHHSIANVVSLEKMYAQGFTYEELKRVHDARFGSMIRDRRRKPAYFKLRDDRPKGTASALPSAPGVDYKTLPELTDGSTYGSEYFVAGGCADLALAFLCVHPEMKLGAVVEESGTTYDAGDPVWAYPHVFAYDPVTDTSYDGYGSHHPAAAAGDAYADGRKHVILDADPQLVADAFRLKWPPKPDGDIFPDDKMSYAYDDVIYSYFEKLSPEEEKARAEAKAEWDAL